MDPTSRQHADEREALLEIARRIWAEDLRRREQEHEKSMHAVAADAAARGIGHSGAHIYMAFETCLREIRLRAEMVRELVSRVVEQSGFHADARDLRYLLSSTFTNMYVDVDRSYRDVLMLMPSTGEQLQAQIRMLGHEQVEALKQQEAELDLLAVTRRPDAPGSVVVNAPVYGAIQTGAGASAEVVVNVDSAGMQALREAVQALRDAIRSAPVDDVPPAVEPILAELEAETGRKDPRANYIGALLASTGSLMEIAANAPGAYDTLRGAAAMIGVPLP